VKYFSNRVFAKRLATVFIENMEKNTHSMIFSTLVGRKLSKYPALNNKMMIKKPFTRMEMDSKTYISLSFFNLPPQVILYGITFINIKKWKSKARKAIKRQRLIGVNMVIII
jgi:hypothetical protein